MAILKVIADATEQNTELAAQAIGVAQRTHRGLLDATGVTNLLPAPLKNATDAVYSANQKIVRKAGLKGASFLRRLDKGLSSRKGESSRGGGGGGDEDHPQALDNDDIELYPATMENIPDRPDVRDIHFQFRPERPLGHHVDLRDECPPIYDQGGMGSCTANSVAAAFGFEVHKQRLPAFDPSRLFIWYNGRAIGGVHDATKRNVGASVRDAIKSLDFKEHGVCSESDWPYEEGDYDRETLYFKSSARAGQKPPVTIEEHAHLHTSCKYFALREPDLEKKLVQCLDEGFPFVFAMKTFGMLGRRVDSNGLGLKRPSEEEMKGREGRHAVMGVGYIARNKMLIVRNSWGTDWGQEGYFYMPYDFLEHCYDFWTIRVVNSKADIGCSRYD